jgi:predicted P-loop ATPase
LTEIHEWALKYAEAGLAVIPVNPKTKSPYTNHGSHDASRDPRQIDLWWQTFPDANVGIVTGQINAGLVVIDLDVDSNKGIDGIAELREWEKSHGRLPDTWRAITGRGGAHLYYLAPGDDIRNHVKFLDCIDVRGEGGYVVAPPSVHPNGNRYYWEDDPEDFDLATADENVRRLLKACEKSGATSTARGDGFVIPATTTEGARDDVLFRLISSMQERGYSDELIEAGALAHNRANFKPPLEDDYVIQKVKYVCGKYQKGRPILIDEDGEIIEGWHEPFIKVADNGKPMQTISNMAEAIEFDKELYGKIRYNELAYSAFVCGRLPWNSSTLEREWSNFDDTELREYIESNYGLRNKDQYIAAFNNVISHHRYNPVKDYLESVYQRWDRKEGHIAKLLPKYLDVENTPYQAEALKLMMLGAVCRIYEPGCKFDHAMIIVGDQGGGKSSFVRLLFQNNTWFTDNFNTIEGDKAAEKLRGMWGVEIAELLALKRSKEVESFKSFLTSTADIYRAPYQRITENRPRMCVFFGTANDTQFMTDKTGNRRFLPIQARTGQHNAKLPAMQDEFCRDVTQAWGEAVGIVKKAMKNGRLPDLVLPPDIRTEAERIRNGYVEEDPRVGIIQDWLSASHLSRVCVPQIYKDALGGEPSKMQLHESKAIHLIMQNMPGWQRYHANDGKARLSPYGKVLCYEPIPGYVDFEDIDEGDELPDGF